MKIKLLLSLLVSLFFVAVNAQITELDSLKILLKNHTAMDTTRVNLLHEIAYLSYNQDPLRAEAYANQAGEILNKLNHPRGKATNLLFIGKAYTKTNNKVAIEYYQKALKMAEELRYQLLIWRCLATLANLKLLLGDIEEGDDLYQRSLQIARGMQDKELIQKSLYNIARIQIRKGSYQEAIKRYQELVSVAKEVGNKTLLSASYNQIAIIYHHQGNYPGALEYYLLSLRIKEEISDKLGMFSLFINIAGLMSEQKDYKSALNTIRKAFVMSKNLGDSLRMSICLTNIGDIYLEMNNPGALRYLKAGLAMGRNRDIGQNIYSLLNIGSIYTDRREFDKAHKSLEEAMTLASKAGLNRTYCQTWIEMSNLYFVQKQYSKAMKYAQKAYSLAEELKLLDVQKESFRLMAEIYAVTGNYNQAYQNHIQYKLLSDSLFNEKNIREMANLENSYKYDKERQKHEIQKTSQELRIKNQKQIILSLIIGSVLLLVLAFFVYWSNKLKKRLLRLQIENINQELEVNQKAMAAATLKLIQNSERDANSIKMLESIEKSNVEEGQREIRSLIADYKFKSYDSNWTEFEILFEKVNSSFYATLNERYPTLTTNERKLCAFLKLNMSNNHISQVTFQSEEALKKARLRLRKKLELDRDTNLAAFIQSL